MARPLNTPITDEGLATVPFYNGRVLSAEDMQADQTAHRKQRAQLGRAQGVGVAHGLRVQRAAGAAPTALRVTKGLALNRAGSPVELYVDVEVSVVEADRDPERTTAGDFVVCDALPAVTATGTGAYLLVACPAAAPREQTPRVSMGDGGRAGSCGPRYQVEGVRFRLVHLDVNDDRLVPPVLRDLLRDLMEQSTLSSSAQSRRRNLLAHWCLGTSDARQAPADLYDRLVRAESPDAGPIGSGLLDALRTPETEGAETLLTPHDVPLALFVWEEDRVTTVDEWAVRRRIHQLGGAPEPATDRRRAEGEASFRQFQAHVAELTAPGGAAELLPVLEARVYFEYLPSLGVVPLSTGVSGEASLDFVSGLTYRDPVFIEGAHVPGLIHQSFRVPPRRITTEEVLVLYRVRENAQSESAHPYLIVASGFLPPLGDARFDLSRWNYGHYGIGIHP